MERDTNQSVSNSELLLLVMLQSARSPQTFDTGKATLTSFYLILTAKKSIASIIVEVWFSTKLFFICVDILCPYWTT